MLKIKKWEQLDGKQNEIFRINYESKDIQIYKLDGNYVAEIRHKYTSDEWKTTILAWLKLFGFNIEFIEPPKLTQKEMDAVKGLLALGFERIQRDVIDLKLYLKRRDYLTYILLPSDLFKGLENCQDYDLSEMLSWGGEK
jgi:hypothetical protein